MNETCETAVDKLEQRLEKLECTNRFQRRVIVVAGTLLGLGFLLGQARPEGEVLTTKALRVVDDAGRVRVECSMSGAVPFLNFYDERGTTRVRVDANSTWPKVELADEHGVIRLSAGTNPKGPGILMHAADKRPRAVLGGSDDGPGLLLFDDKRPRVLVGMKNNQPIMAVLNADSSLNFERRDEPAPPAEKAH